jgi:hypothetical protein
MWYEVSIDAFSEQLPATNNNIPKWKKFPIFTDGAKCFFFSRRDGETVSLASTVTASQRDRALKLVIAEGKLCEEQQGKLRPICYVTPCVYPITSTTWVKGLVVEGEAFVLCDNGAVISRTRFLKINPDAVPVRVAFRRLFAVTSFQTFNE